MPRLESLLRGTISVANAIDRLGDVQANVVLRHGRPVAAHVFMRFDDRRTRDVKARLAAFASAHVRSCADQLAGRADARSFANVLLSAAGYRTFGLEPPADRAFAGGMKRANLNDPPVDTWEPTFRHDLDAAVVVFANDRDEIGDMLAALAPLRELAVVYGVELGEELPGGIEHFGFVDGISQPLFLDEQIAASRHATPAGAASWDPATPLHVVLADDPYGASDASLGSYFVFRKLEQHVARFERGVQNMAAHLDVSAELAGAMVVGRFKDGTPLAVAGRAGTGPRNDFTYAGDPAALRCPFASHVRRVNPRGEFDAVAHTPDVQNRIARRGIPFGRPGDERVGLLFACFQADVGSQFELIQNNWCNFPHFPVLHSGPDPLVGRRNTWDPTTGQKWGPPDAAGAFPTFAFPECVTMRGGEYFFAPSIRFLTGLSAA